MIDLHELESDRFGPLKTYSKVSGFIGWIVIAIGLFFAGKAWDNHSDLAPGVGMSFMGFMLVGVAMIMSVVATIGEIGQETLKKTERMLHVIKENRSDNEHRSVS